MTRRAETELLARLILAAAELAILWLAAPWLRSHRFVSTIAGLVLLAITPAIAAAPQPLVRLILAVGMGAGLPAVMARMPGVEVVTIGPTQTATGQSFGPAPLMVAAWLLPAAALGVPIGMLLRLALVRAQRLEPLLSPRLASAAGVVMTAALAGGIATGLYLIAQSVAAPGFRSVALQAGYAAAIAGASWAWPALSRERRVDV